MKCDSATFDQKTAEIQNRESSVDRVSAPTVQVKGVSAKEVRLALNILVCWLNGQAPSQEDIERLRSHVPQLDCLPPDELACAVIQGHHDSLAC